VRKFDKHLLAFIVLWRLLLCLIIVNLIIYIILVTSFIYLKSPFELLSRKCSCNNRSSIIIIDGIDSWSWRR